MAAWFLEAEVYAHQGDSRIFHLFFPEGDELKAVQSRGELVAGEGCTAYEKPPRKTPNQNCVEFAYLSHRSVGPENPSSFALKDLRWSRRTWRSLAICC